VFQFDNDGGLSYYQFVNEEERAQTVHKRNQQPQHNVKSVPPPSKSKPIISKVQVKKIPEEEVVDVVGPNGGLDYPFDEDDFDTNNKNGDNQDRRKEGEDNFEGYALSSQTKDKNINNAIMRLKQSGIVDIICDINNGKYKIGCKKDEISSEVFIPFSFIHKYFEIYGKLEEQSPADGNDQQQTFTWLHSQVKIHRPKIPYNPKGVFTYFENYNVEVRDRVKCISGSEGNCSKLCKIGG
jgi:hypothetical protein